MPIYRQFAARQVPVRSVAFEREHCTGNGIKMGGAMGAKSIVPEWIQVHPTVLSGTIARGNVSITTWHHCHACDFEVLDF